MKPFSLGFVRATLGLLMLVWGADKLVNVEHGLRVSSAYYLGLFNSASLMVAFGVLQCILGVLIVVGLWRSVTLPALLLITGVTLLGVWKSIIDPWGWFLEGSNALFFPSIIIFAAALAAYAFRDEDSYAADHFRKGRSRPLVTDTPRTSIGVE